MPTPKQQAKEAITNERSSGDPYSVESLRANMATGGGEPIPKGKKRTNEKRVLQPRDPDTGQFEFNSSAMYGRKYPDRSIKDHMPIAGRGWLLNDGIKKGDKVNIDGKVWIAIQSIDKQALIDYFKKFNEGAGEYSGGEGGEIRQKLSSSFIRKKGRQSKEEKEGIEAGQRTVGKVKLSALSKTSKAEMKAKFEEIKQGFNVEEWSTIPLDKKEMAFVEKEEEKPIEEKPIEEKPAEKPAEKPMGEESKPEEKPAEQKKLVFDESAFGELEQDPKGFYEKHKEEIDARVKSFNEKNGQNWSAAKYLKAKLNQFKQKKGQ